jgi:hypothetical protein
VIDPLPKGEPYPGRLPPLRTQWRRVSPAVRIGVILGPLLFLVIMFAASVDVGTVAAVLVVGVWAATAVYIKNRTDRHNAAVDRGEIRVVADPHLEAIPLDAVDGDVVDRLSRLGYPPDDIGQVTRFDGGCIVKRRNRRDVSVVVGDDGGVAYFDPRWVDDLRAASEFRAGRGREPGSS